MTDYEKRLRKLLEKLFQFEQSDLDFGIYRIMNQKRKEINKFIDTDLIEAVEKALAEYSSVNMEEIKHEIEETKKRILETFGEGSVLPNGDVKPEFHTTPLAKEYEGKRRLLQQAEISEEHKAEIFNHVYQFFSRYYDNGDFISKRRYSSESKYAIPYNGEEVILHWANKDQYYIKTTEYFNNYAFEVGDYRVQFRVVSAETAQNNNQNGKRYFVLADADNQFSFDAENNELTVFFEYRELSPQEKTDLGNKQEAINEKIEATILENIEAEILKNFLKREKTKVKKQGKIQSISMLLHHLNGYAKRNTSDYFIHKNLEGFLRRELDFYLKNEVLNLDDLAALSEGDLKRLMARTLAIKKIAIRVIEFLSQIEEFQKKLWEKKKFVVRTDYCMTLDKVPEEFYEEILENEAQMREWKELYKLEEIEKNTLHWDSQNNTVKMDVDYLKSHPYMMLDTKFFDQDFKDRLLATFEDLDEVIGGLLIKSENWQALNLLLEKYRRGVKCIYIDPPYNTGSDEFIYKDKYRHSSWLSMISNRLTISRIFLRDDGLVFISIDDNEKNRLLQILSEIFGQKNFLSTLIWNRGHSAQAGIFMQYHEYVLAVAKNVDNIPLAKGEGGEINAGAMKKPSKRHALQDFSFPAGVRIDAPNGIEFRERWGEWNLLSSLKAI